MNGVPLAPFNELGYEPEAAASFIKLDRTGAIIPATFLYMRDGTSFSGAPFDSKESTTL